MSRQKRKMELRRLVVNNVVSRIEAERSDSYSEADIERIRAGMGSEDEQVRAEAVRQICPCRMSWEVFYAFRKDAKRLQKDPSPLVRANARHIEEDAQFVGSFESEWERLQEWDDTQEERDAEQGKREWRRH